MLCFQVFVLLSKRSILLRQTIETIPQFTIFFLQLQHLCLQLFILLSRFRILAGHKRQGQCHCQ